MDAVIWLMVVGLWILGAFFTAKTAADKGRPAGVFFVLALMLPLVMLIIVSVMQPVQDAAGNVVELVTDITLDSGAVLRRGYRSTIQGVSVIDNTRVVPISDPSRSRRWIAAKAVKLSG